MYKSRVELYMVRILFLITQLSSTLYLPILPIIQKKFGSNDYYALNVLMIFFIGYSIGQLFWGTISDHIGRKITYNISILGYILASLLGCVCNNMVQFAFVISCIGFFSSSFTSVGNAYLKDKFHNQIDSQIAIVGILLSVGPIISPLIALVLVSIYNWKSIFIFMSLISALIGLIILFTMKDNDSSNIHQNSSSAKLAFNHLIRNKIYLGCSIILGISFGSFFSFINTVMYILTHQFNYSITQVGIYMLAMNSSFLIGSIVYYFLSSKNIILTKLMELGLLMAIFGTAISGTYLHFYEPFIMLLTGYVCVMFGLGIVIPAAKSVSMSVYTQKSGLQSAMMKFIQTLGAVIMTGFTAYIFKSRSFSTLSVILLMIMTINLLLFKFLFLNSAKNNLIIWRREA